VLAVALPLAYDIRLYAIKEYGLVIHEFDPWFNYRATEYLHQHGVKAFFEWYDYMSWYPLGRPVGTTIYPGMQLTAVAIYRALNDLISFPISLNDVCCYIPAWFGVSASIFVGLLTSECSGSRNAGVFATLIMACIPAHTMRSVGGGYDNESIAVTALSMTFFLWCRSIRDEGSAIPFGILAGLSYVYMVAAWGGYVFVVNMVGIHAVFLFFIGRFSRKVYWAYTLFFGIGTVGAVMVPVVNWTPLKSLEQMGPLAAFFAYQGLYVCDLIRVKRGLDWKGLLKLRIAVFGVAGLVALVVIAALWPTGYFGPISSRVRSLFVQHTRTGNPLVDSVAEHQPASPEAYYQYLYDACYAAPIGLFFAMFKHGDAKWFLPLYAIIAYFFSAKMVRLIILLGPIASSLSGLAVSTAIEWAYDQFIGGGNMSDQAPWNLNPLLMRISPWKKISMVYNRSTVTRKLVAILGFGFLCMRAIVFNGYCHELAHAMSNPSIMFFGTLRDGNRVLVDDYRDAYFWLRDNTPQDARVMAWWDYGYQIAGIANRTSIADGNTWNHEHIATLGRCLVSHEQDAHRMIRHLADYVLVWTGGGGDDVAKMPHIARIANSVYSSVCGQDDPLCSLIGFKDRQGTPSDFMAQTLVFKLHSGGIRPGVSVDPKKFQNVFNSKYGKVRIWKVLNVDMSSKRWVADPSNRICDPPDSWICKGQYPPKFQKYLKSKKDFHQLENFNVESDHSSTEYQKKYHESMEKRAQSNKK